MTELIINLQNLGYILLEIMIKGFLISAVCFYLASQLQDSTASARRLLWIGYFIALGLVTALTLIPTELIEVPILPAENPFATAEPALAIDFTALWLAIATLLYIAVVCYLIAQLTVNLIRLNKITRSARPVKPAQQFYLTNIPQGMVKVSNEINAPATWGYIEPVIVLPTSSENWDQSTWALVLKHELSHIQNSDWLLMTTAQIIKALFFPMLGVNVAYRSLCLEIENTVDDLVLGEKRQSYEYAETLILFARGLVKTRPQGSTLPRLTQKHFIKTRVTRLLNPYTPRGTLGSKDVFFTYFFIAGITLCICCFSPIHREWSYNLQVFDASIPSMSTNVSNDPPTWQSNQSVHHPLADYTIEGSEPDPLAESNFNLDLAEYKATIYENVIFGGEELKPSLLSPEMKEPQITRPVLQYLEPPVYPGSARRLGKEATVSVRYDVDVNGRATNIRIMDAGASRRFNRSVVRALQRSKFIPGKFNGTPIYTHDQHRNFRFSISKTTAMEVPDTS